MNTPARNNMKLHLLTATITAACFTASAKAIPVQGMYYDDPTGCDSHGDVFLDHELGDAFIFPIDEALEFTVSQIELPSHFDCVPDDGIPNEWVIRIINVSPFDYTNLFYVADSGVAVGNYDGVAEDLTSPGTELAFKLDGTVTPGVNNSLISESGVVDEILSSGEIWQFTITNFSLFGTAPTFGSPGGFAASSSPELSNSNSSILATLVPEPASSTALLGLGGLALLKRNKRTA